MYVCCMKTCAHIMHKNAMTDWSRVVIVFLHTMCLCMCAYRKYVGQIYMDSLVHDEDALKYLVSTMGEDRVILGSDYPFPLGEHHPGKLIESMQEWDAKLKVRWMLVCGQCTVCWGASLSL